MVVVLGGTGHTGSAVARALIAAGEAVTIVTRGGPHAVDGAEAAELDVRDVEALRALFRRHRRAFLLNPPGDPAGDPDADERATGAAIAETVRGSGLEFAVAQSTYGARAGERIGDLGTLHAFEQALAGAGVPVLVQRVAYLMSNFDPLLEAARAGTLPTMFPADFALPMVDPADVGAIAARHLMGEARAGIVHVEGPARVTPRRVAHAFAAAIGRPVEPKVTPREGWHEAFRALGFSEAGAESFAGMTANTLDRPDLPDHDVLRGPTTIEAYVAGLHARAG